jgi:hypothetical protein
MSWLGRAATWLEGIAPRMSHCVSQFDPHHVPPAPVEFCAIDSSDSDEPRARGTSANLRRRTLDDERPQRPSHMRGPCVWAAEPRGT